MTQQIPDSITILDHEFYLNNYVSLNDNGYVEPSKTIITCCYRSKVCKWEVIDNYLYLVGTGCFGIFKTAKPVLASWISIDIEIRSDQWEGEIFKLQIRDGMVIGPRELSSFIDKLNMDKALK